MNRMLTEDEIRALPRPCLICLERTSEFDIHEPENVTLMNIHGNAMYCYNRSGKGPKKLILPFDRFNLSRHGWRIWQYAPDKKLREKFAWTKW